MIVKKLKQRPKEKKRELLEKPLKLRLTDLSKKLENKLKQKKRQNEERKS